MKMKQTFTIHAPSKRALEMIDDYLARAIQDFNDSGESPTGVRYEANEIERDNDK